MPFKKVAVTLQEVYNDNTGDDPGNALELYGQWNVKRIFWNADVGEEITIEQHNLWNRSGDDPASTVEGTGFHINSQAVMTLFDEEVLEISGYVSEQDDIGENDVLGRYNERFTIPEIRNGKVPIPQFNESNQRVDVKMIMSVLQQG